MTLAIHCTGCNKAFNIPPDIYERRVAGKIVTLKCKSCGNPIRIDARDEATKTAETKLDTPPPPPKLDTPAVKKAAFTSGALTRQPFDAKSSKTTNPAIPAVSLKAAEKSAAQIRREPVVKGPAPAPAPAKGPLLSAKALPTQLPKPKATFERPTAPLTQTSFRRPTPAASPSAIRASRPPPDSDPEPPVKKPASPPPAPKRPLSPAQPEARALEVRSSAPPNSGPALESLWAVDLAGSDAELTNAALILAIQQGRATAETLVWRIGMPDWQPIANIPELKAHIPAAKPVKPAFPWPEEPAAVPFEDGDDFADEPTVAFRNPLMELEVKSRPKAQRPQPASRAVHEDSITRTQTDIFGILPNEPVPGAEDALKALGALRTLNAEYRPRTASQPPTTSQVAFTTADTLEAPDFRASSKKVLLLGALAVLVIAAIILGIALFPGEKTVESGSSVQSVPVSAKPSEPSPPPSVEIKPEPSSTATQEPSPPSTPDIALPKSAEDSGFLNMFSKAAAKADLGARAPKRFDANDALNAAKTRIPFAKHCALAKRVTGRALIAVSFAPSGQATDVQVSGDGLTEISRCVRDAMLAARMAPFTGTTSTANLTLSF